LVIANKKYYYALKVFAGKKMTHIKQKDEVKKLRGRIS